MRGSGVRPTLLGVKRAYDCFDIRFRERPRENWRLKYDPDDLSQILAVSEDGTRRFLLEEKYVQPMALADRKDGDYLQLEKVRRFNEDLETHITNETGGITTFWMSTWVTERIYSAVFALQTVRANHKLPAASCGWRPRHRSLGSGDGGSADDASR